MNSNFTWFTGGVPEGSYSVTAKATLGSVTVTSAAVTVIVDRTSPTVVSRSPAPDGIGGPGAVLQAVFSEPMLASSLTDASVVLKVNDAVVGRSLALSVDGRTLTVTPSAALPVPASVNVSFGSSSNSPTDLAGNVFVAPTTPWIWTNSIWSPIGARVDALPLIDPRPSMALGTDGQPFVAFAASADPTHPYGVANLYVRRFDGSSWQDVGASLSAVTGPGVSGFDQSFVRCSAIAVDASNNPVVVWNERSENQQTGYAYHARRYNPTSALWEPLGANGGKLPDLGGPCDSSSPLALKIDSLGRPVVAYSAINGLFVERFDGATWIGLGPNSGNLGPVSFGGFSFALDASDSPVLIYNQQDGPAVVKRFNSGSSLWEDVGPYAGKLSAVGFTLSTPKLVLDASGNPLVAGRYAASASGLPDIAVFRFNGKDGWQQVGPRAANYGVSAGEFSSVAFDQDGNPVLAYVGLSSDLYRLYVKRFNGSSWSGVGASSGLVGLSAYTWLGLAVNAGKLTLAFQGHSSPSIFVIRYP